MSIDWNWGIFFRQAVRQRHLSWLDLEWFSGDDRFVDLRLDYRFPRRFIFGILRTVPNRFLSGLGTLYVELFATCR